MLHTWLPSTFAVSPGFPPSVAQILAIEELKLNKLTPSLALALAFATGSVAAQTNNKLEEIIVVSSRVPMPLREIGTSVSVLAASEIQFRGYASLYDVLRTQPGVTVTNTGGMGAYSPTPVITDTLAKKIQEEIMRYFPDDDPKICMDVKLEMNPIYDKSFLAE